MLRGFLPISRRYFIFSTIANKRKVYEKKKLVGYTDEQMFSVVSDVENYQNFLPWCKKSHVYGKRENFLKGDLIIGFPPLSEKYTSNVTMTKPNYIKAECVDGKLFSYFLTIWRFSRVSYPFPGANKRKVYEKKKLVGYTDEQMFSVVSDVENYQNFLPWCKKSHVYGKRENFLKGDLIIGFPPLSEKYTSNAECVDGKLFSYFLTIWRFSRGLKDISQSCVIDIHVAFEFKSAIYSQFSHIFFDQVVRQMEDAFIREAQCRYGRPAIQSHVLGHRSS
uniref:Putative coenzyme q-binding protein coq10 n=1 Tax=Lutzomyia longipalpis TaxID=7200 RepID=A0A1B0GJF6_LUTLO